MRIFLVTLFLVACGGAAKPPAPAAPDTRTLYERLGKTEGIAAVVKEFVAVTGKDPRISIFFTNTDIPRLEKLMVDHICELTGGPCKYTGRTMKLSHTGMKVRPDDFEAFMDDLEKTLVKMNVPDREKGEVLAAFRSLQADVIEPK
jgi:hemoglobin